MTHNYAVLKVGDRVRFTFVRDERLHPECIEHLHGTVIRESIAGWRVRISSVTLAEYTVTEANYIGHTTPTRRTHAQ